MQTNFLNNKITFIKGFTHSHKQLLNAVTGACKKFANAIQAPKIRLYINGGNNLACTDRLLSYNIPVGGLQPWLNKISKGAEYCLTVNGISAWSDEIANYVYDVLINPILKCAGVPLRGFDTYIFSGKYEFTPFGIHEDPEYSYLLHLGPNSKDAFVWPKELRSEILGSSRLDKSNFDLMAFQHTAQHFVLQPGDFLQIPPGYPHVFKSSGFSTTLGVFPNAATLADLLCEVINEWSDENLLLKEDKSFIKDSNYKNCFKDFYIPSELLSEPHFFISKLNQISLRLKSNGYLFFPSIPRYTKCPSSCLYHVSNRFPITYSIKSDIVEMNLRGHSLSINKVDGIIDVINSLNSSEPFSINRISEILSTQWHTASIKEFLNTLWKFNAIQKIDDSVHTINSKL